MGFDIGEYKQRLIQDIINCPNIVKAIDSKHEKYDPKRADSLLYTNIFPYMHIPKIQSATETYIMLTVDASNINSYNPAFHDIKLTARVMAHQKHMYMKGEQNTRIDYISNELVSLLEDANNYGFGRLRLAADREIVLNEKYIYRELTFKTCDMLKRC